MLPSLEAYSQFLIEYLPQRTRPNLNLIPVKFQLNPRKFPQRIPIKCLLDRGKFPTYLVREAMDCEDLRTVSLLLGNLRGSSAGAERRSDLPLARLLPRISCSLSFFALLPAESQAKEGVLPV